MLDEWIEAKKKIEESRNNLRGVDLSHAKLMKADLRGADLTEADLSFSYLMKANLTGAKLSAADLSYAVICEADLRRADLGEADLTETYLHGADLSEAFNLTAEQVESAYIDKETKFPQYIEVEWVSDKAFVCRNKLA